MKINKGDYIIIKCLFYLIIVMNIICLLLMINKISDNDKRLDKLEKTTNRIKAEMIIKNNYE